MNDKVDSAESLITHRQVTLAEVQRFYNDYGYDVGPRQSKDYTDVIVTDPRVQIAWRVSLNWRLDGDGHLVDPRNGVQFWAFRKKSVSNKFADRGYRCHDSVFQPRFKL